MERYFYKMLQKNPDKMFDLLNICFLNNKDNFLFLKASWHLSSIFGLEKFYKQKR